MPLLTFFIGFLIFMLMVRIIPDRSLEKNIENLDLKELKVKYPDKILLAYSFYVFYTVGFFIGFFWFTKTLDSFPDHNITALDSFFFPMIVFGGGFLIQALFEFFISDFSPSVGGRGLKWRFRIGESAQKAGLVRLAFISLIFLSFAGYSRHRSGNLKEGPANKSLQPTRSAGDRQI